MNDKLKTICEQFTENRAVVKEAIKMEAAEMYAVCAAQICGHHKMVQKEDLLEAKRLLDEMERSYQMLKDRIRWASSDSVQTVSHILTLGNRDIDESVDRFLALFARLQEGGRKYGNSTFNTDTGAKIEKMAKWPFFWSADQISCD